MPIRVAVVDDYELVVMGVARMLAPYHGRVQVVELDANDDVDRAVDVALYDSYAQGEANRSDIDGVIANPRVGCVAMYTWNCAPDLVTAAFSRGAAGYLGKGLTSEALVDAIERIHGGQTVLAIDGDGYRRRRSASELDWPGRDLGLTARESEALALATQGFTVARIAETMYLSTNTVKTHLRQVYRKLGFTNRAQAVLWGAAQGFSPDQREIGGGEVEHRL